MWSSYLDGSSNKKGSRTCILLKNPNKEWIKHSLHFIFKSYNYEAEYKALIAGLELAIKFKAQVIMVYNDSALIINQVNGKYTATNPIMVVYLEKVKKLTKDFKKIKVKELLRVQNCHADAIVNIASSIKSSEK